MADIRCPMCSKFNSPDAKVCAHCGARLTPLRPSSPQPPAGKSGDDEPDWLKDFRSGDSGTPAGGAQEDAESLSDEDVPDWLSRIRDRARTETDDTSDMTGQEDQDEPDWIKNLRGDEPAGEDWMGRLPGSEAGAQEETPDWLGSLSSETSASDDDWTNKVSTWQPDAGGEEPQPPAGNPPADFSWLESAEEPASNDPSAGQPGAGSFVWEEEDQPSSGSSGFGLTGFLSSLEESSPPQDSGAAKEEDSFAGWDSGTTSTQGEDLPDWSSIGQTQETPSSSTPDDDLPGWLQGLEREEPPAQPPAEPPVFASSEEGDLPDWLQGVSPGTPQQPAPAGETNVPYWYDEEELVNQPPARAEEGPADEVPDWLSGFAEPAATAEETPRAGADEESASLAGLPSWLAEDQPEQPAPLEEVQPAGDEALPDWFASFDQEDVDQTRPGQLAGVLNEADQLPTGAAVYDYDTTQSGTQGYEPADTGDVPDWLRSFQDQPIEADAAVSPLISEDEALMTPAAEGDQAFTADLPEWLSEDTTPLPVDDIQLPAEPAGVELAQADLPEWVKEMRPIESMIPGEGQTTEIDQRVEKAGPLAGLRGVLPAEEMVSRWRKPPTYSVKLRVTEKQRTQSSLLESILAQETQPLVIPPARRRAPGMLLRMIVALIMLTVLTLPFLPIFNLEPLGAPVLYPAEMQDMFDQLDQSAQPDAPVLLAVDYQPAFSGEMYLAASSVVDHLMTRNSRIVVVSTVPTGPALAQQLMTEASAAYQERTQQEYDLANQTINLGYLPGGTISLLQFAQQPVLAAPVTLSGQAAWQGTFLQNISGLEGFSQIIVVTDSGETGRAWVEQVQPLMGDVPLFMVTSAQAAPLLTPYVESNQITGMVSGLLGGSMYARLANQSASPAGSYLAPYQVGLLLVFLLILVGGLISGGLSIFKRGGREEE